MFDISIDEPKRYDMKFGGAKQFILSGYEGEKIRVRLASNILSTLQNDFKVKIDDIRKRIDVDVKRRNGVTEAAAKEAVSIFVQIPSPYIGKIECAVNAGTVEIRSLECDSIELDVKTSNNKPGRSLFLWQDWQVLSFMRPPLLCGLSATLSHGRRHIFF